MLETIGGLITDQQPEALDDPTDPEVIVVISSRSLGRACQEFLVAEYRSPDIGLYCFGLLYLLDLLRCQDWDASDRSACFISWKQPLDEVVHAFPEFIALIEDLIQVSPVRVCPCTTQKIDYHLFGVILFVNSS